MELEIQKLRGGHKVLPSPEHVGLTVKVPHKELVLNNEQILQYKEPELQ